MAAARVKIPAGEKITIGHGKLQVPDHPIVAFIEGDTTRLQSTGGAVVLNVDQLVADVAGSGAAGAGRPSSARSRGRRSRR